jgi:outer membrane biosynthesis protein TonB
MVLAGNRGGTGPVPLNYSEVISTIDYPEECRKNGVEGRIIVSLAIDEVGAVMGHEFIQCPCPFLKAAVEAVLPDLKFKPARNEAGEPIKGMLTFPVTFELTI